MQESPGSNRETIETHSLLSQTSVKPLKSHAQHIQKKMHTRKQELMSIILTQRNNTNHESESKTFFYQFNLYMGALHKFSACSSLLAPVLNNVTMYKGGCLYSVCPLEFYNYQIYN
jgi:hypothetical protein